VELALTAEDEKFRQEVRSFLAAELPRDIREAITVGIGVAKPLMKRWYKILHDKGWVAPSWPAEYGGTGWTLTQRHIWQEEAAAAGAPGLPPFGLSMVGPVIYTFGSDEQKKRHLPGILSGDTWWCQGYSEPGSGSDLASLKTRAVRDGNDYIVNGQKIWTSYAHEADWIFALVRTSDKGKPQEGISFLLIDMKTPGIQVRPLVSIDELHHLNEVFFTDVRVPVANRVGEENKGWTYAKFLLAHERTGIANVPESKRAVETIKHIARMERADDGGTLLEEPEFRQRLSEVEIKLQALEITNLRILADAAAGRPVGERSSMLKVVGTEVSQALETLAVEAIDHYVAPSQKDRIEGRTNEPLVGPDHAETVFANYAFGRASTIYGGSNEIQRNIMAKAVLGL
jgi:alkylation response protein AidB-like acyl-CoA dehydrogenase